MTYKNDSLARSLLAVLGSTLTFAILGVLMVVALSVASLVQAKDPRVIEEFLGVPARSIYRVIVPLLVGPMAVNLLVATFTRLPLRWSHLGAWIAHAGVLAMLVGASWYAARSVEGLAYTWRSEQGWSPVEHFYRSGAAAVIVRSADRSFQTPLGPMLEHVARQKLDIPLPASVEGVSLRAAEFLPAAAIESFWSEGGAEPAPAIRVRVTQNDQEGEVVLSPLEDRSVVDVGGCAVAFAPQTTPQGLERLVDESMESPWPDPLAVVATGDQIEPTLVVIPPSGTRTKQAIRLHEPLPVKLGQRQVTIELLELMTHARRTEVAQPMDTKDPRARSVLRVEAQVQGRPEQLLLPLAGPASSDSARRIVLGDGQAVELVFAQQALKLPGTLRILNTRDDFNADVELQSASVVEHATLAMNKPAQLGHYRIFNSSWMPPKEPQMIVLGVSSRPGVGLVWLGLAMAILAMPYAFYIKPLLMRREVGR